MIHLEKEMARKNYPSQLADQFMLRLPDGWRDTLKQLAAKNRRSMNSEILAALERVVMGENEKAGEAA